MIETRTKPKLKVDKNSAPIFEPTCQHTEWKDPSNLCKPQCDSQFLLRHPTRRKHSLSPKSHRRFSSSAESDSVNSLMEEVCLNSEPVFDEGDEYDVEGDCTGVEHDDETGEPQLKKEPPSPTVGLEFGSFDEAYDFYNMYAKGQGFGIRVSNSWFRSKRKERYRAKLSCSSAGFKKKSEANNPRPETRTGCPAMIVIRLVDSKRWRIVEVELEHNHQVSPQIKRFYKSHKKMILAAKKAQPSPEPVTEVHTIKLYRTAVLDVGHDGYSNFNEGINPVDNSKHLELKEEFVDKYDLALHRKHLKVAMADMESRNPSFELKTRCNFEVQLSKVYTKEIFKRFQSEVEGMYSCFNTRQVNVNGPITTYIVKERVEVGGNEKEVKYYEVLYETTQVDIRCICSLFNYKGYLCRHALNVLNYNGVEEIPPRYILPRWSKDFKCRYLLDNNSSNIDVYNPTYLHKCALPIVEKGAQSQEHYKTALQELEELLNKFNNVVNDFV
ncbi:protein FAR1-RELATED SEQUENCE 6-like [Fagus crenata]